jgi:hypothetical protein
MNYDPDIYQRMLSGQIHTVAKASAPQPDERFGTLLTVTMPTAGTLADDPVFKTLLRSRDRQGVHPTLKTASERAYRHAVSWLTWCQNKFASAGRPYVVIPGNGGLTLEWEDHNNIVAITIHESNPDFDGLFFRLNGEKDIIDLNDVNLTERLNEFLLHKNASTIAKQLMELDIWQIVSEAARIHRFRQSSSEDPARYDSTARSF